MDKIAKNLQKGVVESSYRLLSLASITVNKVALPTAQKAYIFVQDHIPLEEDKNSPEYVNSFKRNFKEGMELGHSLAMSPLERIGDYLDKSVKGAESRLREEYGVNTDQWLFSMENMEMLEKIGGLADLTFSEVKHVNRSNSIRYLNAWAVLQRLYLASTEKSMERYSTELDYPKDHAKIHEYKQLQQECLYYSTFANGTYGKILNQIYSERRPSTRLVKSTNYTEDFVFHTKIADSDVLHSFWDTTPYRPAHVIARDQFNKEIVLCMRGTHHWGDAVTDLDFHYLSFSIIKEPNSDKFFLKFHYNEESQGYLKKRLGDDTRELNGERAQPLTGNEIVIETGYAHAGMLVSAIGAFKEITPKLEDIFSKPEHNDYNLAITGHSLGGGMATLMVLLYLIHPIKAMREKIDQKLRGYSYGGASVLSKDFDKYMKHTMKNVILGYDIVPRLSYGSINDLCKIILAFDEINAKDSNVLSEVLKLNQDRDAFEKSTKIESPESERFTSLYRKFRKEYMNSLKLYPMGRVFHIQDFKHSPLKRDKRFYQYAMREIDQKEYFNEIIFSKLLVKHHFPYLYEEGLSAEKIIYQRYLDKRQSESGTTTTPSDVKPYT